MNSDILLGEQFIQNSFNYPENTALWINDSSYSYLELRERVLSIYLSISNLPNSENRIAVFCLPDVNTYASILAISLYGAAYVPLNPEFPDERNLNMLDLADVNLVLNSGGKKDVFITNGFQSVDCHDLPKFTGEIDVYNELQIVNQDLAYILFTSGTTGIPKGVGIKKSNVTTFFNHFIHNSSYNFSSDDRFLQSFELTFDVSVFSFFMPLLIGASCHVVSQKGIKYLEMVRLLKTNNITVAAMVPTVLHYILPFIDQIHLPDLKYSFFVGDKLLHSYCVAWKTAVPNCEIINLYGPTEATVSCTEYHWENTISENEAQNGIVPIGKPFDSVDILILNENSEISKTGELCLAGNQVIENYLDGDKRDRFVIKLINGKNKQYYKTGDNVTQSENGNLLFHGRKDAQVKLNGHRVELGEIENCIRSIITNNFVLRIFISNNGLNLLVLFVEIKDENLLFREEIEHKMAKRVPQYMIPSKIFAIDKIPYNLNGKVDQKAIEELYQTLK